MMTVLAITELTSETIEGHACKCGELGGTCPELPCDIVFETEEWQAAYLLSHR